MYTRFCSPILLFIVLFSSQFVTAQCDCSVIAGSTEQIAPIELCESTPSNYIPPAAGFGPTTNQVRTPFATALYGHRIQYLYRNCEISACGSGVPTLIQAFGFHVTSVNSTPMTDFTVKMKNVSVNANWQPLDGAAVPWLQGPGAGNFVPGATVVYSNTYTVTATGWNMFQLTTPFLWDGTSSILVEICWENTSPGTGSSGVTYSQTAFQQSVATSSYTASTTSFTGAPGCNVPDVGTFNVANTHPNRPIGRFDFANGSGTIDLTLSSTPTCTDNFGEITVTSPTGSGITYSVNNGPFQSSNLFSDLPPGTYSVAIDGADCPYSPESITIPPAPDVLVLDDLTINSIGCNTTEGSITLSVTGTAPFSYSSNPGQQTNSTGVFNGLTAGTYAVTIVDGAGCELVVDNLVVSDNSIPIEADVSVTPNATCTPCDYDGPSVLINEVCIYPAQGDGSIYGPGFQNSQITDGKGEWIELYNPNWCDSVDVSGYILGSYNGSGSIIDPIPPALGMGYVFPQGTIIPPLGFALVRGVNTPTPPAGVVDIVVTNTNNELCVEGGSTSRFWFANNGGWLAFYDNNGVAQDAISWRNQDGISGNPCIPTNNQLPGGFIQLDSYDQIGTGTYIGQNIPIPINTTYGRIPDGGNWSNQTFSQLNSYGSCNDPQNCGVIPGVQDCNGTATVTPTNGTPPYSYSWNDSQNQTTATATGLCAGNYQVSVTDASGCEQVFEVSINDEDEFIISLELVQPSCTQPTGSVVVNVEPSANYSYDWSLNSGVTNLSTTSIANLLPDTYSLTVGLDGCFKDTSLVIFVPESIDSVDVNTLPTSCGLNNGEITLDTIYGGTPGFQFSLNGSPISENESFTQLEAGNYQLLVTDSEGCNYTVNDISVMESQGINSVIYSTISASCEVSDGKLEVLEIGGGSEPFSYSLNGQLSEEGVFINLPAGNYTLTVLDQAGCVLEETAIVPKSFSETPLRFPNIITANNDGTNDYWFVSAECIEYFNTIILNRWGNLIYEYNDINGSWNGTDLNGSEVVEGVYYYKSKVKFFGKAEEQYHGFIQVER